MMPQLTKEERSQVVQEAMWLAFIMRAHNLRNTPTMRIAMHLAARLMEMEGPVMAKIDPFSQEARDIIDQEIDFIAADMDR
jgi:hypothetical protein